MKKIIKPGTRKTLTCDNCGCLFSYEEEDIEHTGRVYAGSYKQYVKCPQCEGECLLMVTRGES